MKQLFVKNSQKALLLSLSFVIITSCSSNPEVVVGKGSSSAPPSPMASSAPSTPPSLPPVLPFTQPSSQTPSASQKPSVQPVKPPVNPIKPPPPAGPSPLGKPNTPFNPNTPLEDPAAGAAPTGPLVAPVPDVPVAEDIPPVNAGSPNLTKYCQPLKEAKSILAPFKDNSTPEGQNAFASAAKKYRSAAPLSRPGMDGFLEDIAKYFENPTPANNNLAKDARDNIAPTVKDDCGSNVL